MVTSGLWTVFNHIMANPSFVIVNWTSKLIVLLITTFVFLFVICYLKNVITTDQLIMKEQKVYRSFQEIVERIESGMNLKIFYTPQQGIEKELEMVPKTRIKERMRHYIVHGYGYPLDSVAAIVDHLTDDYSTLFIDGMLTTRIVKFYACSTASVPKGKESPDTCLHRTQEEVDSVQSINGFLVATNFSRSPTYKKFQTRLFVIIFLIN